MRTIKKIATITAFFLTSFLIPTMSHAEPPGWYAGFDIGETNSHYSPQDLGLMSADTRNLGFSSRIFAGYQLYHPFGVELGYLPFKPTRLLYINGTEESATIKQNSIDMMIKGSLKIKKTFYLIGRFGVSVLQSKPSDDMQCYSTNDYHRDNVTHLRPVFSIGVSYPIYPGLFVQATWLHILEHRAIPEGSFIGLGLTYFPEKLRQTKPLFSLNDKSIST